MHMSFKAVFLAVICVLGHHVAAEQNCSDVQCKLLPVGKDVASEFHSKAYEKGVRIVYFNLKIGNDTYHPLESEDEFLPERWVWAKSIGEPMLSLSYDYDVLSLGLLNYQVRSMNVHLEDQPSGCLADLNSSCQDEVVGRILLQNVTKGSSGKLSHETNVVCVAVIEEASHVSMYKSWFEGNVNYYCCGKDLKSQKDIHCRQPIKSNGWQDLFYVVLNALTIFMVLYCAAFPLLLPDFLFNLKEELEKENRQEQQGNHEYESLDQRLLYLDDASPITCSTLVSKCVADSEYAKDLPHLILSFNTKLAFLFFCLVPFFFYVELGISLTVKSEFTHEVLRKENASLTGTLFSFVFDLKIPYFYCIGIMLTFVFFLMILCLTPKDISFSLSEGFDINRKTVGEKMLRDMVQWQRNLYKFAIWLMKQHKIFFTKPLLSCTESYQEHTRPPYKRVIRGFIALWILPCNALILAFGAILGALCLFLFLVAAVLLAVRYSPYVTIVVEAHGRLLHVITESCLTPCFSLFEECRVAKACIFLIFFVFFYAIFLLLVVLFVGACSIASLSCRFIVRMLGFLIMGLVLNADIASPFVTFTLVAATNLYLCYYSLQKRYKEFKGMIFTHWKGNENLIPPELNININLTSSRQDTIPESLFWYICGEMSECKHKVLPIRREIYCMLRNMAIILIFLFLALCSVIFFGNSYNIPVVASNIALFVSGVIPGLFFKGLTKEKRFRGANRQEMMDEIEKAVEEYVKRVQNSGSRSLLDLDEIEMI